MSERHRARYLTGRRTFKGVEVCEYTNWDQPTEHIQVIAYAKTNVLAEVMCQSLNQRFANGGTVTTEAVLPGGS